MRKFLSVFLVATLIFCAQIQNIYAEKGVNTYNFEDFKGNQFGTVAPDGFRIENYEANASQEGNGAGIFSAYTDRGISAKLEIGAKKDLNLSLSCGYVAAEIAFSLKADDQNSNRVISLSGLTYGNSDEVKREVISLRSGDGQIYFFGKGTGYYAKEGEWNTFSVTFDSYSRSVICILYDGEGFIKHIVKNEMNLYQTEGINWSFDGESLKDEEESGLYVDDVEIKEIGNINGAYMKSGENYTFRGYNGDKIAHQFSLFGNGISTDKESDEYIRIKYSSQNESGICANYDYKSFGSVKVKFDATFNNFNGEHIFGFCDFNDNYIWVLTIDETGEVFTFGNKKTAVILNEDTIYSVCITFCPLSGAGNAALMADEKLLISNNFYTNEKIKGYKNFIFGGRKAEGEASYSVGNIFLNSAPAFYIPGRYYNEFNIAFSSPQSGAVLKENPKEVYIVFNSEININSFKNNTVFLNGKILDEKNITQIDTYTILLDISSVPENENCRIDIKGAENQRGAPIYETIKFGKNFGFVSEGLYTFSNGKPIKIEEIKEGIIYSKTTFILTD